MNQVYVLGRLQARPSFLAGMAKSVDVFNTLNKYQKSLEGAKVDKKALKNDWTVVGNDIVSAIAQYEQKQK